MFTPLKSYIRNKLIDLLNDEEPCRKLHDTSMALITQKLEQLERNNQKEINALIKRVENIEQINHRE